MSSMHLRLLYIFHAMYKYKSAQNEDGGYQCRSKNKCNEYAKRSNYTAKHCSSRPSIATTTSITIHFQGFGSGGNIGLVPAPVLALVYGMNGTGDEHIVLSNSCAKKCTAGRSSTDSRPTADCKGDYHLCVAGRTRRSS